MSDQNNQTEDEQRRLGCELSGTAIANPLCKCGDYGKSCLWERPMPFRRNNFVLFLLLLVSVLASVPGGWWLSNVVSQGLLPPAPPKHDLRHLQRNRSLQTYLSNIQLLLEPTSTSCEGVGSIPLVVLVSSSPLHFQRRDLIRSSWAKKQITYFVMGVRATFGHNILEGNHMEAQHFNDVIVFDFHDHYQNLTLKTALMLKWMHSRCPRVKFLFKTDDDVLVNSWTLRKVMEDHSNAQLIGYRINNTRLHRNEYYKYFVPRWIRSDDIIPQYLKGSGYLINGAYIKDIFYSAFKVPILNVEDVYFTYLVANRELNLTLTHDRRLSPKKPLIPHPCIHWQLATVHSLRPTELANAWNQLVVIAKKRIKNKKICDAYDIFNRDIFMH